MKSITGTDLSKLVLGTIEVYNRYRSPEATAKLLKLEKDGFTIEFEGSFCQSCGVQDFFEDFIYELRRFSGGVEAEIEKIEQTSPQSFKVQYIVKGSFLSSEFNEEALFQEFLQERGLSVRDYMASNPCTKDIIRFHFRTWLFERKPKRSKPSS